MTFLEKGIKMMNDLGYEEIPAGYGEIQFSKQSPKDHHGRTHETRILFGELGVQKYGWSSIIFVEELPAVTQISKAWYKEARIK